MPQSIAAPVVRWWMVLSLALALTGPALAQAQVHEQPIALPTPPAALPAPWRCRPPQAGCRWS